MAYILTPRFAPAYQAPQCNPFGSCAPVSRPAYSYRVTRPRPQRPQYSAFNHFFGQVDELLGEIDREAQREAHAEAQQQAHLEALAEVQRQTQLKAHVEAQRQAHLEAQRKAHRQRQQHKRALRAQFGVNQTEQGWQVDGDIQGFNQENISIEITDEHTLKIAGNTEWLAEKAAQSERQQSNADAAPAVEQNPEDKMDGLTLNEPDFETITEADTNTVEAESPDSDTASHKSYQPTVEDDYEDLGAETSSLVSSPSRPSSPTEVKEPKGKEKAVDESVTPQTTVAQQPQPEAPAQQSQQDERVHGSFERSFRFPQRIDAANVSASFKKGALTISVPRAQAQEVRRIAIL